MPTQRFDPQDIVNLLRSKKVCTMEELKRSLGTSVDMTVLRKLRTLSYRTSYSHRGKYYTLDNMAQFDSRGLWFCGPARFSRYGTLLDTAAHFVTTSEAGCTARELRETLGVEVKEPLLQLYRDQRIVRKEMAGVYVYYSKKANRKQFQSRQLINAGSIFPTLGSGLITIQDEIKAAILLFLSTLNEKQRRLYVGLESMMLGRGGDRKLSELLDVGIKTIARGRRELILRDVNVDRVRKPGGGRKPLEKKIHRNPSADQRDP